MIWGNFELVQLSFRSLVGNMSGFIGKEISRVYRNKNEVLNALYDQRDISKRSRHAKQAILFAE